MLRTIIGLYILAALAFRVQIFYRNSAPCSQQDVHQITSNHNLRRYSDRLDQTCVSLAGVVTQSGSPLWDVFLINCYTLEISDGAKLTVFTDDAVPNEGTPLIVSATFRQFHNGSTFHLIGLVEYERTHLDDATDPPRQKPDVKSTRQVQTQRPSPTDQQGS